MEIKKIKVYVLIFAVIGLVVSLLQLLKLNDIAYYLETIDPGDISPPSLMLNYVFLIFIVAILLSLFVLLYFGLQEKEVVVNQEISIEEEVQVSNEKNEMQLDKVEENIIRINKILSPISNKEELFTTILQLWAKEFNIVQGIVYEKKENDEFVLFSKYAYYVLGEEPHFKLHDGLAGQVAADKNMLFVNNVPENYITVLSGLGSSSPKYLALLPIVKDNETIMLIELAAFSDFSKYLRYYYDALNILLIQKL